MRESLPKGFLGLLLGPPTSVSSIRSSLSFTSETFCSKAAFFSLRAWFSEIRDSIVCSRDWVAKAGVVDTLRAGRDDEATTSGGPRIKLFKGVAVLFMFQIRARLKDLFSWIHVLKLLSFMTVQYALICFCLYFYGIFKMLYKIINGFIGSILQK
ncbi:hypothetical protein RO3G_12190 [Rhizopus delemar RA 99-880]|uniref:Uncharacterized protein n=1 Tax=Rhizopus delemar (strain RA 99-880 / ATCC MYA-4621 / FGSC 9543 / NRRL 43880) TaxID=246409 RepID=I1CG99_RHIO9|nr:hypothetical protein RO3G_12190 [Rhizopus delemar RA 99-880]|eukprot:EIE87479.1 hypothetical protein RO3G_12190 [Rhizopus delemar RA 99-880]